MKTHFSRATALAFIISFAWTAAASSQAIAVSNFGFEDPVVSDGSATFTAPFTGWDIVNGGGAQIGILNPGSGPDLTAEAPEGQNVGVVSGTSGEGGFSQTLTGASGQFQSDANYDLTVQVSNTKFTASFPGYRVQLLAGGTVLEEDDNSLVVAEDATVAVSVNYTYDVADAGLVGQALEIRLLSKGGGEEVAFDDVALTATLTNPVANAGGPYVVLVPGGTLELDGSGSLPSTGDTITLYEWDLNNDGTFGDVTGVMPAAITEADLQTTWGMTPGVNTIALRVTDGSGSDTTADSVTLTSLPTPVAYWPMKDGLPGEEVAGADDLIDDPGHPAEDAEVSGNTNATWEADPVRGIVYSSSEGNRLRAGEQGIDLNVHSGWTWSLWVKVNSSNLVDPGADVIMGSRNGKWNKMDLGGTSNWINPNYGTQGNMADDTWHHMVFVGDTTGGSIYIDGVFMNKDTSFNGGALETNVTDDPLEIGGSTAFSEDITGLYSDVAIWDVALTPTQIADLAAGANILPDATAPVLAATTPADDDAAGSLGDLQIIFDELVSIGTGDIRIVNETDATTHTITLPDPSQVTETGAGLTISPSVVLIAGKDYHVEMDAGVVQNAAGLPFAGIADATTWNFTADGTAPVIAITTPADDALGVGVAPSLSATFDEDIVAGTGNITIKNLTEGTNVVLDVTDSSQVSISGATLTLIPNHSPEAGDDYAIQIDSGAVENLSGFAFGGIADDTTWNWTNATLAIGAGQFNPHPPHPQVPSPITAVSTDLAETFLKDITRANQTAPNFGVTPDWHNGMIDNGSGTDYDVTGNHGENGVIINLDVSPGTGNPLGYTLDEVRVFTGGTGPDGNFSKVGQSYRLEVQDVSFAGTTGNFVLVGDVLIDPVGGATPGGVLLTRTYDSTGGPIATTIGAVKLSTRQVTGPNSNTVLNWTRNRVQEIDLIGAPVLDQIDPTLVSTQPADDSIDVGVTENLVATFDEFIAVGTGNITIKNLTLGSGSDVVIPVGDPQVTIVDDTITIDPTAFLDPSTDYAIQIDATAIEDLFGNTYAGIADTTTWSFTTEAPDLTAPTLVSLDPADGTTNLTTAPVLTITLSEDIAKGVGNIEIRRTSDDALVDTIDVTTGQVAVSGADAAISLNVVLDPSVGYYVLIDNGALTDLVGNAFAGIAAKTDWDFVTGDFGLIGITADSQTFPALFEDYDGQSWILIGRGREGWEFDSDGQGAPGDVGLNLKDSAGFAPKAFSDAIINDLLAQTGRTFPDDVVVRVMRASSTDGTGDYQELRYTNWTGFPNSNTAFTFFFDDGNKRADVQRVNAPAGLSGASVGTNNEDIRDHQPAGNDADRIFTWAWGGHNNQKGFSYGQSVGGTDGNDPNTFLWENGTENHAIPYTEVWLQLEVPGTGGGNDFADWIATFPGASGDTSFGGDPDSDGLGSGLENFFGTDPGVFNEGLVISGVDTGAGTFTFTHPQNSTPADDVSGAAYTWSTDLQTFTADGVANGGTTVSFVATPDTPVAGTTTVVATVTGTPVTELFVQVGVTQIVP